MIDYIIVGQGLAGTVMAFRLLEKGLKIMLIDETHKGASSAIAAGLINPVTGRRLVKSWRIEELIAEAELFYPRLEKILNTSFFHSLSIQRALKDQGDINHWLLKKGYPDYREFLGDISYPDEGSTGLKKPPAYGAIQQAYRCELPVFIQKSGAYFKENALLLSEKFDYDSLNISSEKLEYRGIRSKNIIFCEGYKITENPYFSFIPMVLAKGELLIVNSEKLKLKDIYKHNLTYVPYGNDKYWIGATYEWNFRDDRPSEKGRAELTKKIALECKVPYSLEKHLAAIRPTIKDRRPVMGTHSHFKNVHLFNGLGTKGSALAPYFSKQFCDYLLYGKDLDKEISVDRFLDSK